MKTVFIRLLEASDKPRALSVALNLPRGVQVDDRFDVDVSEFLAIPRSPFAYWMGIEVRTTFSRMPALYTKERTAKQGLVTADDFRFIRMYMETQSGSARWYAFAKGGAFSRYYSDLALQVAYSRGDQVGLQAIGRYGRGASYYFRPGLTWPRRTNGLSFRVMPRGCIFADKGPAIFVEEDNTTALLALASITNSAAFGALVSLQLARTELAQSYEVGLIQQTPVPDLIPADRDALAAHARCAWSIKQSLDTRTETSHAFWLPALMQACWLEMPSTTHDSATGLPLPDPRGKSVWWRTISLRERAAIWQRYVTTVGWELDRIQAEIDDRCFALYGISDEDRASIERGFGAPTEADTSDDEEDADTDDAEAEVDATPMVGSLLSWTVGVALGRFDVRLATGEREAPPEPEPFDPLPPCSPGMLTGEDGLPLDAPPDGYPIAFPTDGILVDDPGHPRDLSAAVRRVFDVVFPDDADARWHEAAELVAARKGDLRDWLARSFFEPHLKRYSKSRRKAPIYWQLATPSASYSVWLYCHRLTADSLFRVLHDYVTPKLRHEEAKLTALVKDGGTHPSTSQGKAIAAQESFVDELRAMREEVERVAPLFHPDLDDGVVLVKAPLWRLVPQHKPWQKELRTKWEELSEGRYDWAHLAMHLWPERVVPKCAEDRSLAIAHDLEDVFWLEDEAGKWRPRTVDDTTVAALIAERTSPAVKDALQKLLEAPTPKGTKAAPRKRRKA